MADSFGGQAGGLGGVIAAFGGSDAAPKPKYFQGSRTLLSGARKVGSDVLGSLLTGLPDFRNAFAQGTELQRGLQGEQADVLRGLLQRRLASDPQDQLRQTGNTLFSFINPNVINPLAQFDVNQNLISRRARGLNTGAFDSTADRLRNARVASGRYYDVARNVYGALPQVYQQLRDAGVTDEMLAAGYIPQIQAGYRNIDMSGLIPLQAGLELGTRAQEIPTAYGGASRANIYGYHQPMNVADRFGAAGQSMWNTVKDAAQIYASLYGGGAGGMMGGGGGGGGGGGAAAARPAAPVGYPTFQQPSYGGYAAPVV